MKIAANGAITLKQQSGKITVLTFFTALILGQINQDPSERNGRVRRSGVCFFLFGCALLPGLVKPL